MGENKGNGTVSVRLADGKVVTVPNVQVDLAVKFEDFDSLEQFTVLPIVVERDQQNLRDCWIQLTNLAQTPTSGGGPPMIRVLLNFPHLVYPPVGRDLALSITSEELKW
ncbi:hypothetical protein PInf_010551 [Phytophthora infestans]|nr:hypothetical protein PInf_010551 [Phytophthora infestans]